VAAGTLLGTKKNNMIKKVDTVVVGSGISGATAAYYLHKKGVDVLMIEAKEQVGGNLISKKGLCLCMCECVHIYIYI
jgi:flavin-dependent dehydrogenase